VGLPLQVVTPVLLGDAPPRVLAGAEAVEPGLLAGGYPPPAGEEDIHLPSVAPDLVGVERASSARQHEGMDALGGICAVNEDGVVVGHSILLWGRSPRWLFCSSHRATKCGGSGGVLPPSVFSFLSEFEGFLPTVLPVQEFVGVGGHIPLVHPVVGWVERVGCGQDGALVVGHGNLLWGLYPRWVWMLRPP